MGNRVECCLDEHIHSETITIMCPVAQLVRACDCYCAITRSRVQASPGQSFLFTFSRVHFQK